MDIDFFRYPLCYSVPFQDFIFIRPHIARLDILFHRATNSDIVLFSDHNNYSRFCIELFRFGLNWDLDIAPSRDFAVFWLRHSRNPYIRQSRYLEHYYLN